MIKIIYCQQRGNSDHKTMMGNILNQMEEEEKKGKINHEDIRTKDMFHEIEAKNLNSLLLKVSKKEAEEGFYLDINKLMAWQSDDEIEDEFN